MISPEEVHARFEQDGYVVLPGFLPIDQMQALNAEIQKHYHPVLERLGALKPGETRKATDGWENFEQFETDVIPWHPCEEGNAAFQTLKEDSRLEAVTRACLGENFTAPVSMVMLATAGGKGQAWHQDCPPEDARQFNLNRLFYTEDVHKDDGAIVVVPGSHRQGRIPPGGNQEPIEGEVFLTPTAGPLVLLSGHVYHRVTPNLSGKPRLSVNFRAFAEGISPDVCSVGVYRGGAFDFTSGKVVAR